MTENVLHVENITMQFGGIVAVNNLSLDIFEGEVVALIGPNGAGKTTAFNCITGVYQPTNGKVDFYGKTILSNHPKAAMKRRHPGQSNGTYYNTISHTPDYITRLGIARTFQNIRLFPSMTVFENVLTAMHMRRSSNLFSAVLGLNHQEDAQMRNEIAALLQIVNLYDVRNEPATSLPYGKQRKLEIARALATHPKLLLLDEPAAGMNPQETDALAAFLHDIQQKFQLTVFLIEHHMNLVMDISNRIYVIDFGKIIADGQPSEIQNNPHVIEAYLGVEEHE